jgi:hypothetical protein
MLNRQIERSRQVLLENKLKQLHEIKVKGVQRQLKENDIKETRVRHERVKL